MAPAHNSAEHDVAIHTHRPGLSLRRPAGDQVGIALAPAGQIKYSQPPLPTLDGSAPCELTNRQHVISIALIDLQNLIDSAEREHLGNQGVGRSGSCTNNVPLAGTFR
jgi:hypothetical protein